MPKYTVARQGIKLNRNNVPKIRFRRWEINHSRSININMSAGLCLSPDGQNGTQQSNFSTELNALTGKKPTFISSY
jgi:hypothetical protein